MCNVVPFSKREADGCMSGRARCLVCRHEWAAAAETGTVWMECPACGANKGHFVVPCAQSEGGEQWICKCGCDVFFITPDAVRCCNCGISHKPFDDGPQRRA